MKKFNSEHPFWPLDKLDKNQSTLGQLIYMIALPTIFCVLFYKLHLKISLWFVYAAAVVVLYLFNALLKRFAPDLAMRFNLFFVIIFYVVAVLITPWLSTLFV